MFCYKCGKEIDESAKFCIFCGAEINAFNESELKNEKKVPNNEDLSEYKLESLSDTISNNHFIEKNIACVKNMTTTKVAIACGIATVALISIIGVVIGAGISKKKNPEVKKESIESSQDDSQNTENSIEGATNIEDTDNIKESISVEDLLRTYVNGEADAYVSDDILSGARKTPYHEEDDSYNTYKDAIAVGPLFSNDGKLLPYELLVKKTEEEISAFAIDEYKEMVLDSKNIEYKIKEINGNEVLLLHLDYYGEGEGGEYVLSFVNNNDVLTLADTLERIGGRSELILYDDFTYECSGSNGALDHSVYGGYYDCNGIRNEIYKSRQAGDLFDQSTPDDKYRVSYVDIDGNLYVYAETYKYNDPNPSDTVKVLSNDYKSLIASLINVDEESIILIVDNEDALYNIIYEKFSNAGLAIGGREKISDWISVDDFNAKDEVLESFEPLEGLELLGNINIESESLKVAEKIATRDIANWVEITDDTVRVRSTPDKNSDDNFLGRVNKGFCAKLVGNEGEFTHIIYHGQDGYVASDYVQPATVERVTKTIAYYIRFRDILDLYYKCALDYSIYSSAEDRVLVDFDDNPYEGAYFSPNEQGGPNCILCDYNFDGYEELKIGQSWYSGEIDNTDKPTYVTDRSAYAIYYETYDKETNCDVYSADVGESEDYDRESIFVIKGSGQEIRYMASGVKDSYSDDGNWEADYSNAAFYIEANGQVQQISYEDYANTVLRVDDLCKNISKYSNSKQVPSTEVDSFISW